MRLGRVRQKILRLPIMPWFPLSIVIILILVALFAPLIAPHPPTTGNLADKLIGPFWTEGGSTTHILGTDPFGRDIFSRLIHGARVSLSISAIAIFLSGTVGTLIGLISGYFGGWIDAVLMRVVDSILAFPLILMAILLAVVLGPSYGVVLFIVSLFLWPRYARQIRGETLSIKEQDFVAMARVTGCSPLRIMLVHILPNVVPTLLVLATLQVGWVIILEASLSFLGVGIPPPTPSWGAVVAEGRAYIGSAWWISMFAGLAILITVLSMNLLGDWVRDRLDPKLRQVV